MWWGALILAHARMILKWYFNLSDYTCISWTFAAGSSKNMNEWNNTTHIHTVARSAMHVEQSVYDNNQIVSNVQIYCRQLAITAVLGEFKALEPNKSDLSFIVSLSLAVFLICCAYTHSKRIQTHRHTHTHTIKKTQFLFSHKPFCCCKWRGKIENEIYIYICICIYIYIHT